MRASSGDKGSRDRRHISDPGLIKQWLAKWGLGNPSKMKNEKHFNPNLYIFVNSIVTLVSL